MNKEKLKKIKVLYYPYKQIKKIITGAIYYIQYIISLFYISNNKKRVKKKISKNEVLNVVFVVQYIPGWNKLEPIYSRMKVNNRFNPVIVCVPLNIQNNKLMDNNGNDTYEYFVKHGYEAIDALRTDGSWIDIKQFDPDYVFHSRPYNHFMPRSYTSDRIVKYALICNVIYGPCFTRNGLDVTLNRDYFKDVYCYFAFDPSEIEYYESRFWMGVKLKIQKCVPYGAIGLEQISSVKTDNYISQYRKTVLWTPRWSTDSYVGGSNFLNYKDTIIRLADKYKNILFIIRPHPLMFGNFAKTGEMTESDAAQFRMWCNNTENVILDEEKEYSDSFIKSDFLIADVSGLLPEYYVTKKGIIYCHSSAKFDYTDYAIEFISTCYEVRNIEELEKYFLLLINNNDYMLDKRVGFIDKYHHDIDKNSQKILEYLSKI